MLNNLNFFKTIDKYFTSLYIEDNEALKNQTIKMLGSILPNIISSSDSIEGLELYKKHKSDEELRDIDLIITDIEMPHKNGLEMIKNIRELDTKIPIVIFSAHDNPEYFQEAIKMGVNGYILKPYTLEQVVNILSDCIKKYKKENLIHLGNSYTWCECTKSLFQNERCIKLSKNETKLMLFLASLNKSIKSSESIENYIFDDFISNNKRVRGLISRFNSKLESNIIESVYAQGYRLKVINT